MQDARNPVDGTRIAYQVVGTGTPLLMVHGTALSHSIWRGFGYVKALQDHYRMILVDMRGHGRSEKPHTSDSYAMDLVVGDLSRSSTPSHRSNPPTSWGIRSAGAQHCRWLSSTPNGCGP